MPVSNRLAIGFLEQQRRDQRGEVGIAAPLPQPVQRALDLARARPCTAARRPATAVSVSLWVWMPRRSPGMPGGDHDLARDAPDLDRQRAAIGVAQDDPPRARVQRGPQAADSA